MKLSLPITLLLALGLSATCCPQSVVAQQSKIGLGQDLHASPTVAQFDQSNPVAHGNVASPSGLGHDFIYLHKTLAGSSTLQDAFFFD